MVGEVSTGNEHGEGKLNCYLRKAQWEDMDMLFQWANDVVLRKNSFSMVPIAYEEHIAWFKKIRGGNPKSIF